MEIQSTILQNISKKKSSHKSKKKTVFVYILVGMLTAMCIMFAPDYMFIYSVLTGKEGIYENNSDTVRQERQGQLGSFLFKNYIVYYQAVKLTEYDTIRAKDMLSGLLEKNISKGLRKKILSLLGELYLLEKEYNKTTQYFWDLLILDTNTANRTNYELASKYADILQVQTKETSNFQNNTVKNVPLNTPVNLETIKQTDTFFLTVSDEQSIPTLPQW